MPMALLWIQYDIEKTSTSCQGEVVALSEQAQNQGLPVFGVTASLYEEVEAFRHAYEHAFPYFTCDATTLKTVIRSNPGLVLLKNGTVVGKWHHNDIPTFEQLQSKMSAPV